MELNKFSAKQQNKFKKYLSECGSIILINKKHIFYNSNIISKKSKNKTICPVIKANAYGMGVESITKILIEIGHKRFFLANISEGIEIRKKFEDIEIYILNCGHPFNINVLKKYNLIPVLNNIEDVKIWTNNVLKQESCIIHIDTGMNRLGLSYSDVSNIKYTNFLSKLNIKFIMTHLACAEDKNNKMNEEQLKEFKKCTRILDKINKNPIKTSICNSSGIWLGDKYLLDIVRPGAVFFGINPLLNRNNPLKEVISLYAQITQIKKVSKNTSIGYGQTIKLKKDSLIGTISIGYSNGFARLLSNNGNVYIKKKKLNILGRVSMDLTVIDISIFKDEEVKKGDLVEIFGPNRSLEIFAKENKTIPYEILCNIGKNIPKLIV